MAGAALQRSGFRVLITCQLPLAVKRELSSPRDRAVPFPAGLGTREAGTERSPSCCRSVWVGGETRVWLIQVETNCVSLRFYLCNWQHAPAGDLV